MNVGISVPLPAYWVDVAIMAKRAEDLGFESFFCAEHPFIPVHTTSRFPGPADGVIPETYAHFVDPFVALARASGVTKTIKLATGIVLVPVPAECGAQYQRLLPNARLTVLDQCGHLPPIEQPDRFADLVTEFLAG